MIMAKVADKNAREKNRKDRISIAVELDVHAIIEGIAQRRGMTNKEVISRLVMWLDSLDRSEQAIIYQQIHGDDVPGIARMILERNPTTPAEQASGASRRAIAATVEDAQSQPTGSGGKKRRAASGGK